VNVQSDKRRASYFIAGAISNSASPFSKTISAFNIFRAGASEGEKYSIAGVRSKLSGRAGVFQENTRKERAAVRNMSHSTSPNTPLQNRQNKTKGPAATEPRGSNGSNAEITLADEENNNKTMPRSPCF
jgi:hypothetical protein